MSKIIFFHSKVTNDLELFKSLSDVIVANRITDESNVSKGKINSRDLFGIDDNEMV